MRADQAYLKARTNFTADGRRSIFFFAGRERPLRACLSPDEETISATSYVVSALFVICGVPFPVLSGSAEGFASPRIAHIAPVFPLAFVGLAFLIVRSIVARLIPAKTALEAGDTAVRITVCIATIDRNRSRHDAAVLACGGASAYAGPMRTPIHIAARNLACRRGGRPVFEHLSFDLAPGDALMLRGANGSGKTSLLRLIAGLLPAESGTLRWAETAAGPWHEEDRENRIAYLAHTNGLKSGLTVLENLRFWQRLTGSDGDSADLLAAHGLSLLADLPAGWLSAGQQRRLALCRLSLGDRPLWLLDEPDTALDAKARAVLAERICDHRARGGSVMVASHHDFDAADVQTLTLGAEAA